MTDHRETKYPRKLSPKEMRLRAAIVLIGLSLAGALCWTSLLVLGPCVDYSGPSPCEFEAFMQAKWPVLSAWGIAGLLVILVVMWARRAKRGGG